MIIDRNYDESLWLMIYNDKKNRDRIVNFIKDIPASLYEQIQESLEDYSNFILNDTIDNNVRCKLSGEVVTSGDMKYWYAINPETKALTLNECIIYEDEEYNTFSMTLYPLKRKKIMNTRTFGKYLLGNVVYDYVEEYYGSQLCVVDFKSKQYDLIKLPLDKMLIKSSTNIPGVKSESDLVDLDIVPSNYEIDDLCDKKRLNVLVRGRKRF